MKIYGFDMADGSTLTNLVVASGSEFPPGTEGELFYRNDGANEGMYVYDGEEWIQIGASALPAGSLISELSGDLSGTVEIGTTSTIYLAAAGSSGTYVTVTTDEKGRVISGTSTQDWSSITSTPTTLSGYGITDAQPLDADLTAIAGLAGTTGILRKYDTSSWFLDTTSYLINNQQITITGDAIGTGGVTIDLTLANTGVSTGTYTKVTVDSKGRVTTATTLSAADIPSLSATYQLLDADLTAIANLSGTAGILKKTAANTWELDTASYATGNENITVSGDVTGSGTTSISVTLSNSGVAAGSYGSASAVPTVTFDSKGRATTASSVSIAIAASQITSGTLSDERLTTTNVTQFQSSLIIDETQILDGAWLARVGSSETISGVWSFNSPVTVGTATSGSHAVTKDYVDNIATGLDMKASVRVATTANITLSGTQTIDGVAVNVGDRVLVKDQNTASQNGIYVVATGAWQRASDADNTPDGEVTAGMYTFVEEGTTNADSGWVLTTNNPITLNSTNLSFVQFNGLGQIMAGAGLTKTGNTINVASASADRVTVNADNIDLATTGTAGTYSKVTTDAYGRVISGTSLSAGDIPSLASTYVLKAGDTLTGTLTGTNFHAADGTVSAPSFSFSADTNTGIYRPSEDTIAFVEGGTEVMRMTSSSYVGIGTTAPVAKLQVDLGAEGEYMRVGGDNAGGGRALRFSSTQSGVSPGALHTINAASGEGQIAFATAGVERMRIDSVGRVAVGTSTYTSRFAVYGGDINLMANATYIRSVSTAGSSVRMLGINVSDVAYVGPIDSGPVATFFNVSPTSSISTFYTSGTEKMRISSAGDVGIGTTSPLAKLHVAGAVSASSYFAASSISVGANSGSYQLPNAWTTSSGALILKNGTDFGKGNEFHWGYFPSPNDGSEAWLMLYGSSTSTLHMAVTDGNLMVGTTAHGGNRLTIAGTATTTALRIGSGSASSPSLSFLDDFATGVYKPTTATLGFSANGGERMRITSAGNIGFGTTSPEVIANYVTIESSGTTGGIFQATNGTQKMAMYVNATNGYAGTRSNHPFLFVVNASERMRLDTGGNLGLGATPSSGISGIPVMQINNAQFGSLGGPNGHFFITSNAYPATSTDEGFATWNYINSTARATKFDSRDGNFRWWSTPTVGTAGSTITFTNIMSLDYAGALLHSSGTTSSPSLSFVGDTNTGIYNPAPDTIGFVEGGTEAMRIDSSGNLGLGTTVPATFLTQFSGSSTGLAIGGAVPTIALVDNEDTTNDRSWIAQTSGDLWLANFNAGGRMIFNNANAERMRIDSSGNLAIGTSTAVARLHVGSVANNSRASIIVNSAETAFRIAGYQGATGVGALVGDFGLEWNDTKNAMIKFYRGGSTTGGFLAFTTDNDTERMRLDVNGNLLVGTTASSTYLSQFSAGSKGLVVTSAVPTIALIDDEDTSNARSWIAQTSGDMYISNRNTSTGKIIIQNAGAERMRIDTSGRVLIGTGSAASQLPAGSVQLVSGAHIASDTFGRIFVPGQQIGSASYAGLYGLATTYLAYYDAGWKSLGGGTASAITVDEGIFSFCNSNTVAAAGSTLTWTTRLMINTSGNVGVGLTPSSWGSQYKAIQIPTGQFASTPAGAAVSFNQYHDGTVYRYVATGSASMLAQDGTFKFYTAPSGTAGTTATFTQAMTLDASGNLGIGVTSSAWGTNYRSLQINSGGASINGWNGDARLNLASNVYWENAAAKYISTAAAAYGQVNTGAFYWYNAPSGTAGTTATFTERMRLDTSGNLGIGNASPVNKLDVTGSFGRGAPVTKAADFSVGTAENWLIVNKSGSACTVTLPTASSWTGREIMIKTIQAQAVNSNASNVVPLAGGAAGTAILAGTAGKWATLVSDGTNWIIMAGA